MTADYDYEARRAAKREVAREANYFNLATANCVICLKPLVDCDIVSSGHFISFSGVTVTAARHDGECNNKFDAERPHEYKGIVGCVGPWKTEYGIRAEYDVHDASTERTV